MAHLPRLLTALPLTLLFLGSPLIAQSQQDLLGDFKLSLTTRQDTVRGKTFTADASYLAKAGKEGWAPFSVVVPLSGQGEYESRVVENPDVGLVKFVFTTPGGGFVEAVSFSAAKVPEGEMNLRLEYLAELLEQNTVPGILEGKAETSHTNSRRIDLSRYKAAELSGSYVDEKYGKIHWRLIGVPNPNGEQGLVALTQISEEAVPISTPNDFPSSLAGWLLDSLRFE